MSVETILSALEDQSNALTLKPKAELNAEFNLRQFPTPAATGEMPIKTIPQLMAQLESMQTVLKEK